MHLRTLSALTKPKGKRVLVRVDFNVRVGADGGIAAEDADRIHASLPTIERLARAGAKVVLVSHLGRPEPGDRSPSLRPVAELLARLLGRPVRFVAERVDDGDAVDRALAALPEGGIAMLENIRFYAGEEKNGVFFARRLASFADAFVNDAFSASHRAHASVAGVAKLLPSYAGEALECEVRALARLLDKPKRPFVVLVGGVKIETKLPAMLHLLPSADAVLIGGGMANNFYKAMGKGIGGSVHSSKDVQLAKRLVADPKIILPVDVLVADRIDASAPVRVATPDDIRPRETIVDIGPATMRAYAAHIKKAATIVWNGPMGVAEIPRFANGSLVLARAVAARSTGKAFGVIGGGDTLPVLARTGMAEHVDHVSMGGGAMLEFLGGKMLPGIEPLIDRAPAKPAPTRKRVRAPAAAVKKRPAKKQPAKKRPVKKTPARKSAR